MGGSVFSAAPSLSLLILYIVYGLICRLYCWRATLPAGTLVLFFSSGCVGSVLVALYLQAIPLGFALEEGTHYAQVDPVTWLTGPTIEEIANVLPLAAIGMYATTARRLSLGDFTLIGFCTGLGFGYVESNFSHVLSGETASWSHIWAFGYGIGTPQAQYVTYNIGHYVSPALVGLALGVGVRVWPARLWRWTPAVAMLVLVAFDHSMWNFKQQHQWPNSFNMAAAPFEALYAFTMHGFLQVWLLPVGVIVLGFLEGRWSWRAVTAPDDWALPGERMRLWSEIALLAQRAKFGRAALAQTLGYLRLRRAAAIAAANAGGRDADAATQAFAALSRSRLLSRRALVASLAPSPWLPTREAVWRLAFAILGRYRSALIFGAAALALFSVAPQFLPALHGRLIAGAVIAASAAFTAWRIYRFFRTSKPEESSGGDELVAYRTRGMLLASSTAASAIPVLAFTSNKHALSGASARCGGLCRSCPDAAKG
jgi:hypothetical protein